MKKNILFRTNFLVCTVIIVGFLVTSILSYQSNQGIFRKDIENVSKLTSEGIYHEIDSIFTKPINISLTMANDSLLKNFLDGEQAHLEDPAFTETMRDYLNTYREKYQYDSVFLASVQTKRYYYFNGLDRVLEKEDPENVWFYSFLEHDEDYAIQIDNDQVDGAGNEVTVFINCRIKDGNGITMGVVGVGFRVDSLQSLLRSYENNFGVSASLIDEQGDIEVSSSSTKYEGESNLFESCTYPEFKETILGSKEMQNMWYFSQKTNGYLVTRFIKNLNWYLIIENDTTALNHKLMMQLAGQLLIMLLIILLVLFTITAVIRRYNKRIVELTVKSEKRHQAAFQFATEQLYENIYEIDVTHNRASSEATSKYFESLGAPGDIPFDQALRMISDKQIKEEFRQGYIDTFDPKNVLKAYEEGTENLQYEFMTTTDGETYYWIRITAHIFYWGEDNSVRMLVYRQNIDEEKRHALYMMEQMQKDSLTGLYNKVATQEHIRELLEQEPQGLFALFIVDIDCFKGINDQLGHAAGDQALIEFARKLKAQFGAQDIVGRIGGDEFIVFSRVSSRAAAEETAEKLLKALHCSIQSEAGTRNFTASIGVALKKKEQNADFETLYKQADYKLYRAKKQGKDRFVLNEEQ